MQSRHKGSPQKRLRTMFLMKRAEVAARFMEQLGEKIAKDLDAVLGPASALGDLCAFEPERDVLYRLLSMHAESLKDMDEALERIDEGNYGICGECGTEIVEKRLQAIPFALCCLECQEEKERSKRTDYGKWRFG